MTTVRQHPPLPEKRLGDFPFQDAGDSNKIFPPVEYKSHWDPTQIIRWTLPDGATNSLPLPIDFRPWTKVCKTYRTSGPSAVAPLPPPDVVFGMGGEFYPPGRYSAAIDQESKLRYLDRRLDKWCQIQEYVPPFEGDMFQQRVLVGGGKNGYESGQGRGVCVADRAKWQGCLPRVETGCDNNLDNGLLDRTKIVPGALSQMNPPAEMLADMAMPSAVLREGPYECRDEADKANWQRSPRLFNNPTKNDKFWDVRRSGVTDEAPPGTGTRFAKAGAIRPALGRAGANILNETPFTERQAPA